MLLPTRFGPFELRPAERCLLRDGQVVRLGARAFDLLLALVDSRGRLVSKAELLDRVWPGLMVEEGNVQVQVSALRKAVGPELVATIPGLGYRFAALLDTGPAVPPPAAPLAQPVPLALDPLLGRQSDLLQLQALLGQHRLVTIAGPGGVGKTRLAQAAALAHASRHANGACWLDLAAVGAPEQLLAALAKASAAGLDVDGSEASLQRSLAGRDLLLVVDNCEHLLDSVAPLLGRLLAAAPALQVLATSRAVLQLAGEQVHALSPLALAAPDATLDEARQCGALQLLEQRAITADRRFVLTHSNLAAAIALCRRLDGLPLAIEMAAARLPLLGLQGLQMQLGQGADLRHAAARDAPQRQRSLHQLFDWSHALLGRDEAILLRRLSIFVGSFGIPGAQLAAAGDDLERWDLVDALAGLVEQSLVKLEQIDPPRYRLLETTRDGARQRLVAAGEADQMAQRHGQAMTQLAIESLERRDRQVIGRDSALHRDDYDDLVMAFERACAHDEGDAAAVLISVLRQIDQRCGLVSASARRVPAAIRMLPHAGTLGQARLHGLIASCGGFELPGHPRVESARKAVELWRTLGDRIGEYGALNVFATESARVEQFETAASALRQAAALEAPDWPHRTLAGRWIHQGWVAAFSGDLPHSRYSFEQAVALCQHPADLDLAHTPRFWMAWATLATGNVDEAIKLCAALLDDLGPDGPNDFSRVTGTLLAQALLLDDKPAPARQALATALSGTEPADDQVPTVVETAALLAAATNAAASAVRLLADADALRAASGGKLDAIDQRVRGRTLALIEVAAVLDDGRPLRQEGSAPNMAQLMQCVRQLLRAPASNT